MELTDALHYAKEALIAAAIGWAYDRSPGLEEAVGAYEQAVEALHRG